MFSANKCIHPCPCDVCVCTYVHLVDSRKSTAVNSLQIWTIQKRTSLLLQSRIDCHTNDQLRQVWLYNRHNMQCVYYTHNYIIMGIPVTIVTSTKLTESS